MIVVVGRVQTDAERREELIRVAQAVASASREEEGCLGYRFYADTEQENHYVFVEEWKDLDALKAHFQTPHIAEFMAAVPGVLAGAPDIGFHVVERTMGLGDFGGGD